jgi:hypothetical protein
LISDTPAAVIENTINRRVSGVTGIANPVRIPRLTSPIPIKPVRAGANVTTVPGIGEKVLSGVVELYNCAVMVIVEPIRDSDTTLLKKAAMSVIVPLRGTEKAILSNCKGEPVRSIVAPSMVVVATESPNAIKLPMPVAPNKVVVIATGVPDEKGMIAPLPAGPVAPVAPVVPVPVAPVSPVDPLAPVEPVEPVPPVVPVPVAPVDPVNPVVPVEPVAPVGHLRILW